MRRRFALPLAGTLLTLAGAAPLAAQDTSAVQRPAAPTSAASLPAADSLPTGRGRWALEGGLSVDQAITGPLPTVGVLHFIGPRSALGFNAFGQIVSQSDASGDVEFAPGGASAAVVGATAGYRRYGRVRGGLAGFGGAGALLSYTRFRSGASSTRVGVGGYGELGATYLVARRLGVNASTQLAYQRTSERQELGNFVTFGDLDARDVAVEPSVTRPGWELRFGGVRLSATLFF